MKLRPGIWLLMGLAAAAMGILLWPSHRENSSPSGRTQQSRESSIIPPITKTGSSTVAVGPATGSVAESDDDLSAAVNLIVDQAGGFAARSTAVHALSGSLSEANLEKIYSFLSQSSPADAQQNEQVLKNDLLNALCQMEPPPAGLRGLLTQIYQNAGQDVVLRDYAVQHLAAFYRQMGLAAGVDTEFRAEELKQTQDVLWTALNDTGSSIAGSALLGLSQLSAEGWSGINQNKIGEAAARLAADNNTGELARITAFQVCAQLKITDALPAIWDAAHQAPTLPLQISAIAALGILGNANHIPFLNELIAGDNDRLRLPAQHVLQQLNQRLNQSAKSS